MNNIKDKFGRTLRYLRISVTDRCNFRCRYCMPQNNFNYNECDKILRYEDILFAVETFTELGVRRLRITGGEPLVRKGLVNFLSKLTKIKGIDEVMLTTNGVLLNKFAQKIYESGVKRLNISLDSLKEDRNNYITGVNTFGKAIEGIKCAAKAGFKPIKVNVVVIKGFNDDEIEEFCNFAIEYNIIVRFIEFMPIGNSTEWGKDSILTGKEILSRIKKFNPILLEKDENTGPARNYKLNNGATIGIITPISRHFCDECDKLRLTSDGKIRPCLLSDKEIDLTNSIKNRNKDMLKDIVVSALLNKAKEHDISIENKEIIFKRTMSRIGG